MWWVGDVDAYDVCKGMCVEVKEQDRDEGGIWPDTENAEKKSKKRVCRKEKRNKLTNDSFKNLRKLKKTEWHRKNY